MDEEKIYGTDLIESGSSDPTEFRMHITAIRHAGNRYWSLNTVITAVFRIRDTVPFYPGSGIQNRFFPDPKPIFLIASGQIFA